MIFKIPDILVEKVQENLSAAEDSLQRYQQNSGMLEVKEQTKLIIDSVSRTLENNN